MGDGIGSHEYAGRCTIQYGGWTPRGTPPGRRGSLVGASQATRRIAPLMLHCSFLMVSVDSNGVGGGGSHKNSQGWRDTAMFNVFNGGTAVVPEK